MDQISDKKNKEENWVELIALAEAMKCLDQREKHIVTLRFFEGRTQMEVAEEIGISQAQGEPSRKKCAQIHATVSAAWSNLPTFFMP